MYREERVPLVRRLLQERPWCEACPLLAAYEYRTTFVHHRSVDIHEKKSRARGGSILDESNLLALCRSCHIWVTDHPIEAKKLGLLLSSWD